MNDPRLLLETFAQLHVLPSFRERFVHEALKKSTKLQSRICHTIADVFPERYRNGATPFQPQDICILITGSGVELLTEHRWHQIDQQALRGFGLLVASPDGSQFYAETEAEHQSPSISYSSASAIVHGGNQATRIG